MTTTRIIALYIHPDTGPITPMKLDLMAVETVALGEPSLYHDDARAREIARLIKAQFPKIDPQSGWRQITSIPARLSSANALNGIVLRLPGVIDVPGTTPSKSVANELDKLTHEVQHLEEMRRREQQEHNELKAKVYSLQNENKRLKMLHEKINNESASLRVNAQQGQDEVKRAQMLVERANKRADKAEQDIVALQVKLEAAQKEAQKRSEAEYFALRQKLNKANKTEEQLQTTITNFEQEIFQLRERLRILTETPLLEDMETNEMSFML